MSRYLSFARESRVGAEDLVLVIDASGSMSSSDFPPSRLEAALRAAHALVEVKRREFPGDRAALVTFGCEARLVSPLVPVTELVLPASLQTHGSTNVRAGLQTAASLLLASSDDRPRSLMSRVREFLHGVEGVDCVVRRPARVILLSDGYNTALLGPGLAARALKNSGVVIHTVGVGGQPTDVDECELKSLASLDDSGQPRYCFIGDSDSLVRKFEEWGHIRPLAG